MSKAKTIPTPQAMSASAAASPPASPRRYSHITADVPPPGHHDCSAPFTSNGRFFGDPADILGSMQVQIIVGDGADSRVVTGVVSPPAGAPNPAGNAWSCAFPVDFPRATDVGVPMMLVVTITTRDSGITTVNVPFTHRRGTSIGPATVLFTNILSNRNITITGHVGPAVTSLHATIGLGSPTPVPIANDSSFAFTTTGSAPSVGDGDPITFTVSDGTTSADVEFPIKFKRDTAPPYAIPPVPVPQDSTTFILQYSELMTSSVLDPLRYQLTYIPTGAIVAINDVVLSPGSPLTTSVEITTDPLVDAGLYGLMIDTVSDIAGNGYTTPFPVAVMVLPPP